MRRAEREARLTQLAVRLLGDARRVLTVGVSLALADRTLARAEAHALTTLEGAFDGALVGIDADTAVRALVAAVSPRLADGAALLLVAPLHPTVGARARGLLTRTPPPRVSCATVCEALLGAGLCTPRVHDDVPGLLLASARVPRARGALDVFFTQPT